MDIYKERESCPLLFVFVCGFCFVLFQFVVCLVFFFSFLDSVSKWKLKKNVNLKNCINYKMKLSLDYSKESINFLDLIILKDNQENLHLSSSGNLQTGTHYCLPGVFNISGLKKMYLLEVLASVNTVLYHNIQHKSRKHLKT